MPLPPPSARIVESPLSAPSPRVRRVRRACARAGGSKTESVSSTRKKEMTKRRSASTGCMRLSLGAKRAPKRSTLPSSASHRAKSVFSGGFGICAAADSG